MRTTSGMAIAIALASGLAVIPAGAHAQALTARTIRIVVPFSAGGSNDVIARAIAGPLSKRLDLPVIVVNRPGAAGDVGSDHVAKSTTPRRSG